MTDPKAQQTPGTEPGETPPIAAATGPEPDETLSADAGTTPVEAATTTAEPMSDTSSSSQTAAESASEPEAEARPAPKARRQTGPYAVIETGGKQYRVYVGDRIAVERLPDDAGADITLERVLLLGGDGSTRIGTPVVDGATVTAHIDDHYRGDKIIVFKYKPKKRYRRRQGHRQELTRLTITNISG